MSESMITRCPKCSTTFRVTEDVLKMAKGKVRCGQCFHIFTAEPLPNAPKPISRVQAQPTEITESKVHRPTTASTTKAAPAEAISHDGTVDPDWLNTLFNESDLDPYVPPTPKEAPKHSVEPQTDSNLAPWELELAELEEQFTTHNPPQAPVFSESLKAATSEPKHTGTPAKREKMTPVTPELPTSKGEPEPDYMQALHSLAQDISKQDTLSDSEYASKESIKQLAAEYSLASLTESDHATTKQTSRWGWLWGTGILIAIASLMIQVSMAFFEQGSRSPEFRSMYRIACSYLGCTLPAFQDISAISIEHVRVQSHPTNANTLQVNAIMTNTSKFSQPMPKLALEFYDLNGNPVAARLFAPQSYLHKDFLDITYMPPSTPIHVVIPIQDPGARAVTHQIKVFSSDTRSY